MKYDGTTGIWALVMINNPPETGYTQNDLHMYKDLVYQTAEDDTANHDNDDTTMQLLKIRSNTRAG